jgi:2-hydroxy-3-keto-5-methylthiopentenyl-1-phosphate phosphatase
MLDKQIASGERSFRDVSEEMWGSLNVPFDSGFEVLAKELVIDPDFQKFHKFCVANDMYVFTISPETTVVLISL